MNTTHHPEAPTQASDTPRTDAAEESASAFYQILYPSRKLRPVHSDFARTLERELAAARAENERLTRTLGEQFVKYERLTAERDALVADRERLASALAELYQYEARRSDADTAWERPMMQNARLALDAARAGKERPMSADTTSPQVQQIIQQYGDRLHILGD